MSAVSLSLGVADLSGGAIGEFSTYGSGERVSGVRVRTGEDPSVGVRLVVQYGRPLPELVDEVRSKIRAGVTPLFGREVPVNIEIVDVTTQAPAPAELEVGTTTVRS